jgi:hypothetical protein
MTSKALTLATAGLLMMGTAAMAQDAAIQDNYGSNSAAGNNASTSNGAQNAQGSDPAKTAHKHKRQARTENGNGVYTGGGEQKSQNSPNPSSQEPANPGQ